MTAERLQRLVLKLANQMPTQYWLQWPFMSIEIPSSSEHLEREMVELGMERSSAPCPHGGVLFTVERDDEP